MNPACRNSLASRSIADTPPSSASRARTTLFTCVANRASQAGLAAVPTRAITALAGNPAASKVRRSKPPSTSTTCSSRHAGASKPNHPAGLVLIQRLGAPGWSSKALWAFSSIPGSHWSSVRPINPCPSGEPSGKMMRPIQRFKSCCCSFDTGACSQAARER